jgi:acetyl-CoA acetyltransferase
MREVAVIGVGMNRFGKYPEKGIKQLVEESVTKTLEDAGVKKSQIEAAFVGNAAAGLMTGQEMIRGQTVLSALGIDAIPIYNVENACASSSSAFNMAWMSVASGVHDVALVVGFEKLYDKDKMKSYMALATAVDVERMTEHIKEAEKRLPPEEKILQEGAGQNRSIFMDLYAFFIRQYMEKYGLTQEHFAKLSVKAHKTGALNPHAQYQKEVTVEEVLNSGDVVFPLTRMMCSPIGDGSAAAVLCAKPKVAQFTSKPVWVAGSVVGSGKLTPELNDTVTRRLVPQLYEKSGLGPEDVDLVELHDTTSPSEIMFLIELGLCPAEDAAEWIDKGELSADGRMPTNTSGGLACKGHPIGATGCGQIHEVVKQLRDEAGKRQVQGAKIGMTHNGGGILGTDAAAMALHMFKR